MNCVNFQATLLSVSGVCLLTVLVSKSLILVVFQQEMAAILEVSVVRFKRVFDIRWLSLGNCVTTLIRNYEPLMVVLEESAAAGDATAIGKSAVWLRNGERATEKYDCMPADEQSYLPSVHLSMVMFVRRPTPSAVTNTLCPADALRWRRPHRDEFPELPISGAWRQL